jgi:hypothetical protein
MATVIAFTVLERMCLSIAAHLSSVRYRNRFMNALNGFNI